MFFHRLVGRLNLLLELKKSWKMFAQQVSQLCACAKRRVRKVAFLSKLIELGKQT